jgi:hypothetical protein
VCDIAELIRAHPNLNWEHIVAQASEFGMERRLYLGLFLANCMLDAPLPQVIETKIHTNPHVRTLARQVMEKVFDGMEQTTRFPYFDRFTFQLRAMDRITDRSRYLLRFAMGRTAQPKLNRHL